MKTDFHPQYFQKAKIKCANCGHIFETGATSEELNVEICSQCHPFFTGKKILIDTEGRVDRFRKKSEGAGGRVKKVRKKKSLEDRVNEELAVQLQKDKAAEAKVAEKKAAKKATKAEAKVEEPVAEAPVEEKAEEKAE